MAKNQRKQFLINPQFQLTVLAYTVGMAAVIIGIFYAADQYFFWKFTQTGLSLGLPPDHVFFQFLSEQKRAMNFVFAITSACAFTALSIGGLLLSHRVAGPIYRLCKHMKDIAEGRTMNDTQFREKDFFPELAEAFNRHLSVVREKSAARSEDKAA